VRRFGLRWTVIVTILGVAMVAPISVASAQSTGGSSGGPPKATEVGVTPSTINIAVIADVNTPLAPGLFQGSATAVEDFANYINKHGGIAGRKLHVDFIDSKLSADESLNALIQACSNDFATVGTTALFMNNVTPAVNCKDINGKATGMPDIPELTTSLAQQQSPVSFPIIAPERDFSAPTETYDARRGQGLYFTSHDKNLHGVFLVPADLTATKISTEPGNHALQQTGIKDDGDFNVFGTWTQDNYLPIAAAIKQHGSTYVRDGSNDVSMADMRLEAQQQGVNSVKVWDCSLSCYSQKFLQLAGSAGNGQYLETFFVPLEEAKSVPDEQAYINSVGGIKNASGFGAQAWIAALFFQAVLNKMVAAGGVNSVTRANFFKTAATIHNFTAGGMTGPTDIGGKKPSGCYDLLQVQNQKFVRVYPKKAATFDCSPKNLLQVMFHAQ